MIEYGEEYKRIKKILEWEELPRQRNGQIEKVIFFHWGAFKNEKVFRLLHVLYNTLKDLLIFYIILYQECLWTIFL